MPLTTMLQTQRQTASRPWLRILLIAIVVFLAALLRSRAASSLEVDVDEQAYVTAGAQYAACIQYGDWAEIPRLRYNYEHPPFVKLFYGVVLSIISPPNYTPYLPFLLPLPDFQTGPTLWVIRYINVSFGVMNVLLLSLINPIAGAFLAAHTYAIKWTSGAYLESLPMLTSSLAVVAYLKSRRKWNGWLIGSAVALGVTAASKYLYCIAGIAIAVDWLVRLMIDDEQPDQPGQGRWQFLTPIGWGLLSLVIFVVADPALWPGLLVNLGATLEASSIYAYNPLFESFGWGPRQPFVWLFSSIPWNKQIIITRMDTLTAVLGLIGIPRMWRRWPVYVLWWVIGMLFLVVWPARLPHYILVVITPVAICAGEGVTQIGLWITGRPGQGA